MKPEGVQRLMQPVMRPVGGCKMDLAGRDQADGKRRGRSLFFNIYIMIVLCN
jgi:hypothetical protein